MSLLLKRYKIVEEFPISFCFQFRSIRHLTAVKGRPSSLKLYEGDEKCRSCAPTYVISQKIDGRKGIHTCGVRERHWKNDHCLSMKKHLSDVPLFTNGARVYGKDTGQKLQIRETNGFRGQHSQGIHTCGVRERQWKNDHCLPMKKHLSDVPLFTNGARVYGKHTGQKLQIRETNGFRGQHSLNDGINLVSLIYEHSPPAARPYLDLIRFDKPTGTWLLYLPCTWSIALAAHGGAVPDIPSFILFGAEAYPDLPKLLLFGIGAFVMRGAGCIINDMWDSDIDRQVARTASRPLAAGVLSHRQALVCLSGMLSAGLCVLCSLNWYSIGLGASSMLLVVTYPLMKRVTYWPQLVLGMAFNWGTLLGWSAVRGYCDWSVCLPLYVAGISWTLIYDTLYAHQDKHDDVKVGIKSTALLFGDNTKMCLTPLAFTMTGSLLLSGYFSEQLWPYYAGVGLAASHLAWQIITVDLGSPADCMQKFRSNVVLGVVIFGGIVISTLMKPSDDMKDDMQCEYESKSDTKEPDGIADDIQCEYELKSDTKEPDDIKDDMQCEYESKSDTKEPDDITDDMQCENESKSDT